jgi:hypothetical protein
MAVSSIYQNSNKSRSSHFTIVIYALIVVGLLALVYFGSDAVKNLPFIKGKSAITAEISYGEGELYLNDKFMGNLPYTSEDIPSGENKVTIKGNGAEYEVLVNFLPGTEVVIKRDLGVTQIFSAGQNLWLEKNDSGTVLSVISEPADADVYIDGTRVGQTPYSTSDLSAGAYELRVEKNGYETQTSRIDTNNDHKLNVSVTLFPMPVADRVDLLDGSSDLYDVSSENLAITSDPSNWVKAIIYWNETRGVNLSGVGVNKELVFDYYLDYNGNLYNGSGTRVSVEDATFFEDAEWGAYLRRAGDEGLSEAAKSSYQSLGGTRISAKEATVLETGVGWLRVRDEPSLDGEEITRVNVGETFAVLEEATGWVKIRISPSTEGWVSADYVEITGGEEAEPAVEEETAEDTSEDTTDTTTP